MDIKDSPAYKDKVFPAALRELQSNYPPPTGEQQLEAICSILDRYALPEELEGFLVAMVGHWLAGEMKKQGLNLKDVHAQINKGH